MLNTGYSLSQTPFIGIVKGFFNGNSVGYDIGYAFDVIGYASRGAENYDCLYLGCFCLKWLCGH